MIIREIKRELRHRFYSLAPEVWRYPLQKAFGRGVYQQCFSEKGVLFVHVPKAAGTSVVNRLYGKQSIGHFTAMEFRAWNPALFEKSYKFCLVRNPWARVLSAYNFVMAKGTSIVPLDNRRKYSKDVRFRSFEAFVKEWLPHVCVDTEDYVFRSQHKFICDMDGNIIIDKVFKVENIGLAEIELSEELGEKVEFQKLNTVGSGKGYRQAFDKEMIDIIDRVYGKDIQVLGYRFCK